MLFQNMVDSLLIYRFNKPLSVLIQFVYRPIPDIGLEGWIRFHFIFQRVGGVKIAFILWM
jgi:hypothetical protein